MGKFKMAALMAGEWVDLFIDFHCFLIEIWLKLQLIIEKYLDNQTINILKEIRWWLKQNLK